MGNRIVTYTLKKVFIDNWLTGKRHIRIITIQIVEKSSNLFQL